MIDYAAIAEEYGTPVFVTQEERIRERYRQLRDSFAEQYPNLRVYYACKANSNLEVLRILESEGACVDAVSAGEVFLARRAGFSPDRIMFTGNNVDNRQLEYVASEGVTINVDSFSELRRLAEIDPGARISFRLNPGVGSGHHEHCVTGGAGSKFGVENPEEAFEFAIARGFSIVGIHMHIGSGILESGPYLEALESLLESAAFLKARGVVLEFIDIGGGFGVPYRPEEEEVDMGAFASEVVGSFRALLERHMLGEPVLAIEPGRFLVADSTVLVTRVNTVKRTPGRNFVGVDSGFHIFPRPTLYGSYHGVRPVVERDGSEVYSIAGQICESGDILARDRELPRVEEGDLLLLENAGAYCFSMASEYNSNPLPAEVLVSGGNHRLIRRRGTYESLLRDQEGI